MKIAMISYHACPLSHEEGKETGGMQIYVYNLSLELARFSHQVDVFTRSEDANAKKIVEVYPAAKARGLSGAGVAPNFKVIHLVAGPEKTLPKKELLEYIPEFSKELEKYISAYDIIHAHYYMSGLAVLRLNQQLTINREQLKKTGTNPLQTANCKLPTIVSFHTLALLKNLVARAPGEAESQTRIDAEMELVQKVDKIIAPSAVEREYLKYFYSAEPNRIEIIPPGYDSSIFHPMDKIEARKKIGADPQHKIILFVGRIEPLKGLDVLMYALKILTQRCPACPICLWIVGGEKTKEDRLSVFSCQLSDKSSSVVSQPVSETDKPKTDELESENRKLRTDNRTFRENPELKKIYELHHTLKLHSYVRFISQQHQHELSFFYNAADVVVMPSHYESFGMSALEAMACGTPVVTTNVTGISTMFENDGGHTVISANNPLQLARAIEKIIGTDRQKKLSLQINNFTWAKMAGKMEKVYAKLIRNLTPRHPHKP